MVKARIRRRRDRKERKHSDWYMETFDEHPKRTEVKGSRKDSITIRQLRTGKSPLLRQYMYRIGKADSPTCLNCDEGAEESAEHLLVKCPRWEMKRRACFQEDVDPRVLFRNTDKLVEFLGSIGYKR